MYMRVLDVYNEYLCLKKQRENPGKPFKKVKVLDTVSVRKIIQDAKDGGLSEEIDTALEDFYENDIFILPVFKNEMNRWCVVVIQIISDTITVGLYDRKRHEFSEEEIEQYNYQISHEMQDFLERALLTHGVCLDEDKIEGTMHWLDVSNENDMIPAIIQLAENTILYHDTVKHETVTQVRHKVLDRLISLYLLE